MLGWWDGGMVGSYDALSNCEDLGQYEYNASVFSQGYKDHNTQYQIFIFFKY